jgi:3-oxoacyl-[acyl-carrier-protein] synthase III
MIAGGAAAAGGRRSVVIESLGVYLPERAVSTSEVVAGCAVPLRIPLERLSGIRNRRVAGPGEFSVDLARAAIEDCLARSHHAAEAIDLLICASISRYDAPERLHWYEPSAALRLKAGCGFERAIAFDVSNGCAGLWTGILLAESMISAGLIERALIVSGEFLTHLTRTAQYEIESYLDPQVASLTVGDSGAAVILEAVPEQGVGLQGLDLYTLGRYAGYCVVRPTDREHGGWVMLTDSLRLRAPSIEHALPHLLDTLRGAGWSLQDVAHVVPHQTSETTLLDGLRALNERFGPGTCPAERYRINLAERANTATTTHFIAIRDAIDAGQLRSGDRVAFSITGSGLTIGAALYVFDGLPERLRAGVPGDPTPAADGATARPGSDPPVASIAAVALIRGAEASGLDTIELCRRAGRDCLARAGCPSEDVELMIYSGIYRTDFIPEPATAAFVAGALDINAAAARGGPRRTLALDLFAGHLGTLKACWAADQMIRAGRSRRVLVFGSDVENNARCPEHGLYGLEPAGSALLIERGDHGAQFELFHFRDYLEHLSEFESYLHNPDGRPRLAVRRQPGFAAHAAHCLATTVRGLLGGTDCSLDCFDAILAPAGFPELEAHLIDALEIDAERLVTIPARGDLSSSSLAAGLRTLEEEGRVCPGSRALVLAVGAGIQTGCAVVRFR